MGVRGGGGAVSPAHTPVPVPRAKVWVPMPLVPVWVPMPLATSGLPWWAVLGARYMMLRPGPEVGDVLGCAGCTRGGCRRPSVYPRVCWPMWESSGALAALARVVGDRRCVRGCVGQRGSPRVRSRGCAEVRVLGGFSESRSRGCCSQCMGRDRVGLARGSACYKD